MERRPNKIRRLYGIPLLPFALAAIGLPMFGKASGAKAGVKKTLATVGLTAWYIKLFLIGASAIILALLAFSIFMLIRRGRQRRAEMKHVLTVLGRIEADVLLLKGES